jgi:DNA-binding GntR family transcriptional regulator
MKRRQILEPLAQESTPALIAVQLRRLIGEGQLAPGEQLIEADIAADLGVSRGPVREAIQRLTQEGLLLSIRNRGVFVTVLGEADIRDIYEARTAVEEAAGRLILGGDFTSAGRVLSECVADMEQAFGSRNAAAMTEADMRFHEQLVSLSHSPRLSRMHNTLLTETRMCLNALEGTYEDESFRVAEHLAMAKALENGNRELLSRLLADHKDDALTRIMLRRDAVSARSHAGS